MAARCARSGATIGLRALCVGGDRSLNRDGQRPAETPTLAHLPDKHPPRRARADRPRLRVQLAGTSRPSSSMLAWP
eukprot:360019-Chlamydomonas_euryale.AAC.13